jgi:hypothetical protein
MTTITVFIAIMVEVILPGPFSNAFDIWIFPLAFKIPIRAPVKIGNR